MGRKDKGRRFLTSVAAFSAVSGSLSIGNAGIRTTRTGPHTPSYTLLPSVGESRFFGFDQPWGQSL